MGKDLYENYPQAKEVFDKASDILKFDIKKSVLKGLKKNCRPRE